MSECPGCKSKIRTPSTLDLNSWAEFKCENCEARLVNNNASAAPMLLLLLAFGLLAQQEMIDPAVVFSLAFFTLFMELYKVMNPKLRLKPPPPEPEVKLHLEQQ